MPKQHTVEGLETPVTRYVVMWQALKFALIEPVRMRLLPQLPPTVLPTSQPVGSAIPRHGLVFLRLMPAPAIQVSLIFARI